MEKKDRYHLAIDYMRIIAILAVLVIHSTTRILEASSYNLQGFPFAFFLNQLARFAVPLFFMISGFVLEVNYPFHQSYKSYFKKRISRIFLPYLFWSAVYYFLIYQQHTISFWEALLRGNASYQLYFIPTLIIFYAVFPLLHKAYPFLANKWTLIVLGIGQIALLANEYYVTHHADSHPLTIALLNYYILILGMIAAHHHQRIFTLVTRWKLPFTIFLGFLGLGVFLQGKFLYIQTHNYLYFYSQWRPSVLVYTIVFFAVAYVLCNQLTKYQFFVHVLSRLTFGVFFIHVIVLELLWNFGGKSIFAVTSQWPFQQAWYTPLYFFSIAGISYGAIYLLRKIPYLAQLIG